MKLPILLTMVSVVINMKKKYIIVESYNLDICYYLCILIFFIDIPLEENKKFIEIEKLTGKVKTTKIIDREEWNSTSYFMVIYISY